MLYKELVDHCSPTLAGIKTGNLFSFHAEGEGYLAEVRELNKVLVEKGLRLIPVRRNRKSMLIYLYRPERLHKDLFTPEAMEILREKGYPCGNPEKCVACLIHHLETDVEFPHEIGLFLGYPPSDVKCFMSNSREGVQCVGCWKVYGDVREAEKTFECFKQCTRICQKLMNSGTTLEQLIVQSRKKMYAVA